MRRLFLLGLMASACGTDNPQLGTRELGLTLCDGGACYACNGNMSSMIPSDHLYVLTSFGGGSDTQPVACGGRQADGMWWYAADRQRFGCGTHLRVENPQNGACVVLQVADAGPDICVEEAAAKPVLDATPMVASALFNVGSSGWSDGRVVRVTVVDSSLALGPCSPPPPPPSVDASVPPAVADASTPDASPPDAGSPDASITPPPHHDNPATPTDRLYGGCSVVF